MMALLRHIFGSFVNTGDLLVTDSRGRKFRFGDGTGKTVAVRFTDQAIEWRLLSNPGLALGEAYMERRLVVERGTLYEFLELLVVNTDAGHAPGWMKLASLFRRLTKHAQQFNPVSRARRNAAAHYNIDRAIYDLFLDADWQYSCAYFEHADQTLDDAQLAKKRHLAAKLKLDDGHKVLDIGSGWGGLGLYLARAANVDVTGITLSDEQLKASRHRAKKLGLGRTVDFRLRDYRQLTGRFDRIVSVGMFEHVGVGYYRSFFRTLHDRLADDGVAVLHSIGRFDGPATTNPFIAKYIFPGGYIPALSEVIPAIERSGLLVTDIEILRLHYAETLRHWRERFLANRERAAEIQDEWFCRMWEFYLAAAETAFRYQNMMVFQIQLTRNQNAVPLTREYMHERERQLRERDEAIAETPRLAGE